MDSVNPRLGIRPQEFVRFVPFLVCVCVCVCVCARALMCEIYLYHSCYPEQSPKAPSAHRCLEHHDAEPPRKGPDHSRIRVVVGVVKRRPSRHALFVASEPEILRERWMHTSE